LSALAVLSRLRSLRLGGQIVPKSTDPTDPIDPIDLKLDLSFCSLLAAIPLSADVVRVSEGCSPRDEVEALLVYRDSFEDPILLSLLWLL
jgi:hypothetical protein